MKLHLADDLALPLEVVTETVGFLGRRGSGKSYAAMRMAEEMHRVGAQFIAIDPAGIWWGLRLAVDGKAPGLPIPVLGGLHGDVPLEAGAGELVANLVVDRGISAVIDVSQFESDADKARFARDFAARFFYRKKAAPSAVHMFIEECVPPDTEVLTDSGWRPIHAVKPGDLVVSFRPKTGTYHREAVVRVIARAFDGHLIRFCSTSIDCAVTPRHRAVLRRFQHDHKRYLLYPWTFCEAEEAPRDFQVPSGGAPSGDGVQIGHDELRVLGWLITDGYRRGNALGLSQAITTQKRGVRIVDEMRRVLRQLGAAGIYERRPRETTTPNGTVRGSASVEFYLGVELSKRFLSFLGLMTHRIPRRLLTGCTTAQLRMLYQGLLEGDGTAKGESWSRFYAGLNEGLADDFQELATRLGIRTVKKRVPQNGQWIVAISATVNHWVRRTKATIPYHGNVYCITVPSGAFVARRNGTVFVTGNCQEFVPQNPEREEARMLHAFARIAKIGRNFGIGLSLISQRPQEVNKKVLNLAELLFCFQLTGPQERKTMQGWIADKGIEEDIQAELPKLAKGEPHVWSPVLLDVSKRVKISTKHTFDSSGTPKVGAGAAARVLSPIDLKELAKDMAATIERAKAEDPKELQAEVQRLRRELSKRPEKAKTVDQSALHDAERSGYERGRAESFKRLLYGSQQLEKISAVLVNMNERLSGVGADLKNATAAPAKSFVGVDRGGPDQTVMRVVSGSASRFDVAPEGRLPKAERLILTALAQYPEGRSQAQVAILAGYAAGGGAFRNALGALRSAGRITGGGALLTITEAGLATLGDFTPLPTGRDLLGHWLGQLGKAERSILETLADAYPRELDKEETARRAGYEAAGGAFRNALGRLRTLELVTGRAELRASEDLFDG